MGENKDYEKVSPDLLVTDTTPTAFIWHTSDDSCVNVINSYLYATALRNHNIEHEMHVFPNGPHGLGLAGNDKHVSQWTVSLINWFTYNGWL
jgi:dipeptidyl aminopeptidase/acylaminoacyl peptidase